MLRVPFSFYDEYIRFAVKSVEEPEKKERNLVFFLNLFTRSIFFSFSHFSWGEKGFPCEYSRNNRCTFEYSFRKSCKLIFVFHFRVLFLFLSFSFFILVYSLHLFWIHTLTLLALVQNWMSVMHLTRKSPIAYILSIRITYRI